MSTICQKTSEESRENLESENFSENSLGVKRLLPEYEGHKTWEDESIGVLNLLLRQNYVLAGLRKVYGPQGRTFAALLRALSLPGRKLHGAVSKRYLCSVLESRPLGIATIARHRKLLLADGHIDCLKTKMRQGGKWCPFRGANGPVYWTLNWSQDFHLFLIGYRNHIQTVTGWSLKKVDLWIETIKNVMIRNSKKRGEILKELEVSDRDAELGIPAEEVVGYRDRKAFRRRTNEQVGEEELGENVSENSDLDGTFSGIGGCEKDSATVPIAFSTPSTREGVSTEKECGLYFAPVGKTSLLEKELARIRERTKEKQKARRAKRRKKLSMNEIQLVWKESGGEGLLDRQTLLIIMACAKKAIKNKALAGPMEFYKFFAWSVSKWQDVFYFQELAKRFKKSEVKTSHPEKEGEEEVPFQRLDMLETLNTGSRISVLEKFQKLEEQAKFIPHYTSDDRATILEELSGGKSATCCTPVTFKEHQERLARRARWVELSQSPNARYLVKHFARFVKSFKKFGANVGAMAFIGSANAAIRLSQHILMKEI